MIQDFKTDAVTVETFSCSISKGSERIIICMKNGNNMLEGILLILVEVVVFGG